MSNKNIASQRKKERNRSSTETPRTLLEKVVKEKIQRHSSTYVFNGQRSNASTDKTKLSSKTSGSGKSNFSTIHSDSDENISPDFLLFTNDVGECHKNPTDITRTKKDFKFSRPPNRQVANSLNKKGISSIAEKSVSLSMKRKKPKLNDKNVKTRKIDDYFDTENNSSINKSITEIDCFNVVKQGNSSMSSNKFYQPIPSTSNSNVKSKILPKDSLFVENNILRRDLSASFKCTDNSMGKKITSTSFEPLSSASIKKVSHLSSIHSPQLKQSKTVPSKSTSGKKRQSKTMSSSNILPNSGSRNKVSKTKTSVKIGQENFTSNKSDMIDKMLISVHSSGSVSHKKQHNKITSDKLMSKNTNIIDQIIGSSHKHRKNYNSDQSLTSEKSSIISGGLLDNTNPSSHVSSHDSSVERNIDSSNFEMHEDLDKVVQVAESNDDESERSSEVPRVPDEIMRNILLHFSDMPIPNNTLSVVNVCCDDFWEQTLDTLNTYAKHAGRQTITIADVELLLYRQGFVKDRHSINELISKYLPHEMCLAILPIATAGNNV